MKSVITSFAGFHAWALDRLLEALEPVPDADYRRDCGLFFRSLHGTLNVARRAQGGTCVELEFAPATPFGEASATLQAGT